MLLTDQTLFDIPEDKIMPPQPLAGHRAFYRSFAATRKTTQVHVLRDAPIQRRRNRAERPEGWCGISAVPSVRSPVVALEPMPAVPPDGMRWCAACIGHLAHRLGRLGEVGELLATTREVAA